MADIDRRRGKWVARWRDGAGRQHSRAFGRKLDAERFLADITVSLAPGGSYIDPSAGKIPLRSYAEVRWLPAQVHLRPNSAVLYESHLRNHIVPLLGEQSLAGLRRTDCKALVASLSGRLAPSTVHTVYAVLSSLMQSAVDDGLIAGNPCSRVPLPLVPRSVVTPLSAAEVLALADAISPRYRVTVWLGAGAGLREGEALGLTVPRVAFLARRLVIVEQMQNRVLSALKTRASKRTIPVDDLVLSEITRHMQRFTPGPGGLLVTNRLGKPVQRNSFGSCWREAVAAAGLPAGSRFHDLRHFYASALISAGLHPKVIQSRLGHATIAETMDTYGHLFPEADESGRGALDAMFASQGKAASPADVRPMCASPRP